MYFYVEKKGQWVTCNKLIYMIYVSDTPVGASDAGVSDTSVGASDAGVSNTPVVGNNTVVPWHQAIS